VKEEKEIKIRKTWPKDFNPETKIETPKPLKKTRSSEKQALKKALNNIDDFDDLDLYE